jgi:phenylacetate-coenzyme A ligase PaaK-like adenylate-forming protein
MTTLAEEQKEQERWTARLKQPTRVYDTLLEREFEEPERRIARTNAALDAVLRFAAANVPHYRQLFQQIGADPKAPDFSAVLPVLPILRKLDLRDSESEFLAERLLDGERAGAESPSSGTTGTPVTVLHSARSNRMFALLKQREYRWFRFDPGGTLASIRPPRSLVKRPDGSLLPVREDQRLGGWPPVRGDFSTGPAIGFSIMNAPEDQLAWLRRIRPDYLLILSSALEHLAFTAGAERPCASLKAVLAIAEELTAGMRAHVERSFAAPIHQNYGLNEIGLVAGRCEAGRYHVHSEHCLVEIVRADGSAANAGETGRLIVTGLSNLAMPLLRYDADDLAVAVDGPCPCGRTLPSFADIVGRFSQFACLPDRSFVMFETMRAAIQKAPADQTRDLQQYQLHQFRDGRYELRLLVRAPLPDVFAQHVQDAWAKAASSPNSSLTLRYVDAIERGAGGKYQAFSSDFIPKGGSA